jgi:hypothetical protein
VSTKKAKIRRLTLAMGFVLIVAARTSPALAESPVVSPAGLLASTPRSTPIAAPFGLAVVALAGATDAAWPLAQSVYAATSLRPPSVDESRARVLCGEPAPAGAPPDLHDLAETVAAVRGDDPPSRALLASIALLLSVRAVVVVEVDAGRPAARVFLAETGAFDAASYVPDDAAPLAWSRTTQSILRAYDFLAVGSSAPVPATPPRIDECPSGADRATAEPRTCRPHHRAFYESGWFWTAFGAAALAGGAVFLATRDSRPPAIHLQLQVPH